MEEQKILWNLRVPDAGMAMCRWLNQTYPGLWGSVRYEHVDAEGYWYTYELVNDDRRQTWCVRHSDLEG